MSVVIRHVSVENELEVKESLLGFMALTDQHAEKMSGVVCNFLEKNDISVKNAGIKNMMF